MFCMVIIKSSHLHLPCDIVTRCSRTKLYALRLVPCHKIKPNDYSLITPRFDCGTGLWAKKLGFPLH